MFIQHTRQKAKFKSYPISQGNKLIFSYICKTWLTRKESSLCMEYFASSGSLAKPKLRTAPVQAHWCGWSLHTGDMVDLGMNRCAGIAGNQITEQVVL